MGNTMNLFTFQRAGPCISAIPLKARFESLKTAVLTGLQTTLTVERQIHPHMHRIIKKKSQVTEMLRVGTKRH